MYTYMLENLSVVGEGTVTFDMCMHSTSVVDISRY